MSATGTIVNFAYGSNMLAQRLRERVPSARFIGTGQLQGHTLRWHKSGQDASGKCDAFATGNAADTVHGVLYELPLAEKPALDRAEGLGAGYDEKTVRILTPSGPVRAHVYYATHIDPALAPFAWYKALVVAGARQNALPPEYLTRLLAQSAVPDPDPARALRNEKLLDAR